MGPKWEDLGGFKTHLEEMHLASLRDGWELRYIAHEQCDKFLLHGTRLSERQKEAYEMINPKHWALKKDLLSLVLMRDYGGLWLDLRGAPSGTGQSLEPIIRPTVIEPAPRELNRLAAGIPSLALVKGGQWGRYFSDPTARAHGEITIGAMWSARSMRNAHIWNAALTAMTEHMHLNADSCISESMAPELGTLFDEKPCQKVCGRDGTLFLGALAITAGLIPALKAAREDMGHVDDWDKYFFPDCMSAITFNKLTQGNAVYKGKQGGLLYKSWELGVQHKHYADWPPGMALLARPRVHNAGPRAGAIDMGTTGRAAGGAAGGDQWPFMTQEWAWPDVTGQTTRRLTLQSVPATPFPQGTDTLFEFNRTSPESHNTELTIISDSTLGAGLDDMFGETRHFVRRDLTARASGIPSAPSIRLLIQSGCAFRMTGPKMSADTFQMAPWIRHLNGEASDVKLGAFSDQVFVVPMANSVPASRAGSYVGFQRHQSEHWAGSARRLPTLMEWHEAMIGVDPDTPMYTKTTGKNADIHMGAKSMQHFLWHLTSIFPRDGKRKLVICVGWNTNQEAQEFEMQRRTVTGR